MVSEALVIMFIGMGIVFAFLCVLVIAMYVSASVVPALEKMFPTEKAPGKGSSSKNQDHLAMVAAAVAVAVAEKIKN